MPAAPGNFPNAGHFYSNLTGPVSIDLNFIVDSSNGNGLGVRSVKSNGYVKNVFMHTTAPLAGSGNPNPAAGYAIIQLAGNFNRYIGGSFGVIPPLSSSNLTSVTAASPYVITTLGTATAAQWQAIGLPLGITPAVGVSFIATASTSVPGSATVGAPGVSAIISTQVVGDPNLSLNNANIAYNGGGQIMIQFINTSDAVASPANGAVVGLRVNLDRSSVNVDGL